MKHRERATIALLILASSGLLTAGVVGAVDGLTITNVDVSADAGTIEFSLPASVADGLDPETAVVVLENGAPMADAQVSPVPSNGLEVVLVIDVSGSMREGDAIDAARQAASGFLDALPREVPVGVVAFGDMVSLTSPLGTDRAATRAAIEGLQAKGETALYDALVFSQQLFSGGTTDRQIVLLSDGGDTLSTNTQEAAVLVATSIRTNVIELTSSEANTLVLAPLASAKGGFRAAATDPAALAGLYGDVADDLLNRFRVAFTPSVYGDVTYTVRVATANGTLEAATVVAVAPPPTTIIPTSTSSADTSASADVTPAEGGEGLTGGTSTDEGVSSNVLRIVGGGALFFALLLLLLLATTPSRERRPVALEVRNRAASLPADAKPGLAGWLSRIADRVLARGGKTTALAERLDVAGIPLRPGEFLVLAALAGTVASLVLAVLLPPVLGVIVGVVLTPLLARALVSARIDDRRKKFVDQLPDLLQTLVSSLRAGYGLPQALDVAASQSIEPTKTELQRVLFEVRIGRDPGDALAAAAERMASSDFSWVVAAMQINREVGGELAVVLENVADTVRERQRLRRQIRVLTAEGRISAYVLTALPFLLAVALLMTNPDYFEPFGDSPGPLLVVMAGLLLVIGWAWIRRLVKAQM